MRRIRSIGIIVTLGVGTAQPPAPWAAHGIARAGAPAEPEPKGPSAWLKKGRAHWIHGDFAASGEAYERAAAAMTPKKQKADEGAQAILLAVDAYWSAFDLEASREPLDRAEAACTQWLELAGPDSRATLLGDVQRALARIRAVVEPLRRVEVAAQQDDFAAMAAGYDTAVAALQAQARPWPPRAKLVLVAAEVRARLFEAEVARAGDDAPLEPLHRALASVEVCLQERPASEVGPLRGELEARREQLSAQIEALREARLQREQPSPPPPTIAEPSPTAAPARGPLASKTLAYSLLPAGLAAIAGGATLVALGVTALRRSDEHTAALEQDPAYAELPAAERARFDEDLQAYERASSTYALGTLIAGSALLAGGTAMTLLGSIALHQVRRSSRSARARVSPVWTRTMRGVSLQVEF